MVDETLPPEFEFGKVVGRAIHAIADTAEDIDDKPQARPAAGTVTFTPRETLRVVTTPGYKAFVASGPEKANLSATGRILDAEGRNGIWLVAGVYDVTFQLSTVPGTSPAKLPALVIAVTAAFDDANPFDLADAMPYVPPTGAAVTTMLVPAGGDLGDRLTKGDGGVLVWAPASSGGTATTDASLLTSGILPAARIGSASITDSKLASGTALTGDERTKLAGIAESATANRSDAAVDSLLSAKVDKSANLSDLASAPTARTNLGLGTAAVANTGTTSGTVPLLSTGGVLPVARLATGTPTGTKFVRDDGTLAVPAGGGAGTTVLDTSYASLEVALAAVPTNGTLEVHGDWSRGTAWTIDRPCTVRFVDSGKITSTGDATTHAVIITSSNVHIENPWIVGPGAAFGTAMGIRSKNLAASPLNNLTVRGGDVGGFARVSISFENVTNAVVENVYCHDNGYTGIEFLSVLHGLIRNNRVVNITMPSGFVNAYGIGVSRDYSVTANPQSQDVTVESNYVRGIPAWEGIDTHAGINIRIINNEVYDCLDHIVVIGGKNTSGTNTYAPRDVIVSGNRIDSGVTNGSRNSGIVVNGVAGSGGVSIDPATGITVENNVVRGCGNDSLGANVGGINFNNTKGIVVTGNSIIEPAGRGINCYDTNVGAVITDNTIVDVWMNSADDGTMAAIAVRANYNTPTIANNILIRGSKTATLVNTRGFYTSSNTSGSIEFGINNLSAATTPVADTSTMTVQTFRAKKMGFFGKTPIALPAANATDLATHLVNLGLAPAGTTALGSAAAHPATDFATPADVAAVSTSPTYTPASATWHLPWPGTSGAASGWSLNVLNLYPMLVPADMSVVQLQFETTVAAGAGGVMRLAAYKASASGLPDMTQLIKDFTQGGTIATDDAAGVHTVTFSAVTLPKGLIYVGFVAQVAATLPTLRTSGGFAPLFTLPVVGTPPTSGAFHGYTKSGVTGALPTSGALTAVVNQFAPRIYLLTA